MARRPEIERTPNEDGGVDVRVHAPPAVFGVPDVDRALARVGRPDLSGPAKVGEDGRFVAPSMEEMFSVMGTMYQELKDENERLKVTAGTVANAACSLILLLGQVMDGEADTVILPRELVDLVRDTGAQLVLREDSDRNVVCRIAGRPDPGSGPAWDSATPPSRVA